VIDRLPRIVLHAEGAVVLGAAVALYLHADFTWWVLVALFLAPDLSLLGFLGGQRLGATLYDAAHTYVFPTALAAAGVLAGWDTGVQVGLIWIAHLGIDRAIGYGLRYRSGFERTHLQRV
jgi:hypothetical protein